MVDQSALLRPGQAALPASETVAAGSGFPALPETVLVAVEPCRDFLQSVFRCAPYLARQAQRRPETLALAMSLSPDQLVDRTIEDVERAGREAPDVAVLDRILRDAKADVHLVIALADLAGLWTVEAVTEAMTRFADACVHAALTAHARFNAALERLPPVNDPRNPVPGLYVMALGKMGTGELNYSSDIDLVVFFDAQTLVLPEGQDPRKRLPRLVQAMVKSLQDITADGYVFRVDLRLRPDPGATPVIISSDAALNYYESLGQTWERAAWIKARTCAGDHAAGALFLDALQPFIWRRALDYAAVDDIRSLARQIQTVGRRAVIQPSGHDLKLGRGGIREIEFFAQVPQLVFGGRDRDVRVAGTLRALEALAAKGVVEPGVAEALAADYRSLRAWEHRIQMRQDEASQTLPERDEDRIAIAAMSGFATLPAFEAEVERVLREVHGHFSDQFQDDAPLSSECGTLILTGVEPTPDTLQTLTRLGFHNPESVWKRLNGWAGGRVKAVRNARARNLFAQLAPRLVDVMASTGEPDAAFTRFAGFFENLPMGVQPLSLLANEPELAADLITILTMAPKLASDLSRRPDLLDVMLDTRFSVPLAEDPPDAFRSRLRSQFDADWPYEDMLNLVRRAAREERFRISAQIVRGGADAQTAGAAFSDLADAAIEVLCEAACAETVRRYGEAPGDYVVLGMGKLGGRELSADSDVDLMIVYDGPIETQTWFTRFAQRAISALSVPTEEGALFEVDMQLRPSGKSGPVAVQISRFDAYYMEEAWTWELMALTRARVVAGSSVLGDRVLESIEAALSKPRAGAETLEDVRAMRSRLEAAKPARSDWDLKARPGGLLDIEFIAQGLQVLAAPEEDVVRASTVGALSALVKAGRLASDDALFLSESLHLNLGLAQLLRAAHGAGFDPDGASEAFATALAKVGGADSLVDLQSDLGVRCERVRSLYFRYLGQ